MGSSAMSRSGLHVMAMAIMARWRMPPENSCGYMSARFDASGMPTRLSISMARFWRPSSTGPRGPGPSRRSGADAVDGFSELSGSWKIMAISPPADLLATALVHGQQVVALPEDLAGLDLQGRQQAHDGHGGDGLASPTPHHGEQLTAEISKLSPSRAWPGRRRCQKPPGGRGPTGRRRRTTSGSLRWGRRRGRQGRRRWGPGPSLELGVQCIAEAVTDEDEGEDGQEDGHARKKKACEARPPTSTWPRTPSGPRPGVGGTGPTPRNDRAASAGMMAPTSMVA